MANYHWKAAKTTNRALECVYDGLILNSIQNIRKFFFEVENNYWRLNKEHSAKIRMGFSTANVKDFFTSRDANLGIRTIEEVFKGLKEMGINYGAISKRVTRW